VVVEFLLSYFKPRGFMWLPASRGLLVSRVPAGTGLPARACGAAGRRCRP